MSYGNLDDEDDDDYPPFPPHGEGEDPDEPGLLSDIGGEEDDDRPEIVILDLGEADATPYE